NHFRGDAAHRQPRFALWLRGGHMLGKGNTVRGMLVLFAFVGVSIFAMPSRLSAQGNSGAIQGTVVDPSKAAVPGATVRIQNPVSAYATEIKTGTDGAFRIQNLPFNSYHLTVTAMGFSTYTQDVDVRSTVPVSLM